MDRIKRLITLLEQRGMQPNFLINLEDTSSHESRLYFMVRDEAILSDKDAVQELYGKQLNAVPTSYRMLKSRVKKKLFNQLHLLNLHDKNFGERKQMRLEAESLQYRASILFNLDEYDLVIELVEKVLQIAKEYDFYDLQLNATDLLKGVYYYKKDIKKLSFYTDVAERLKDIVLAEREAQSISRKFRLESGYFVDNRYELLSKIEEAISRLKELWERNRTYRTFEYYYLVQIQLYEQQGDFTSVIEFTKYADKLVADGMVNKNIFDRSMNIFLCVYAHLRAELYDKGLELAAQALPLYDKHSGNWFAHMENYILLALYKQDYTLASNLIEQVNKNKFSQSLPELVKERWCLINAFIDLVTKHTVSSKLLDELKEASYISKDKQGFYVYVNVLEFMYLLFNHQTSDVFETYIDRYRKYAARYLKNDKVERIKIFYKLMTLALREAFDYEKCAAKGEALFQKLKVTKAPGEAYAEVEIVPYEHLWELALDIMKQRHQDSVAEA
ncbi:hypothetical protein [Pontibacter ruber]|uniref:Tetratricopeptide repeat protein n=1 Tax=Pontibacter ruber TaxID=1343895 RepID=A0ABW5CRV7_9BACT|nr:hypothetical protein [Pontibacter ruber]